MRKLLTGVCLAVVLGATAGCISPPPKTPEQKVSASAAASRDAGKTRDEAYTRMLGTGQLTDQWRLHAAPALGAAKSVSATYDVPGGKTYMLALDNNKRPCYVVFQLVTKAAPHSPVVNDDSPRPGDLSEWSYRLMYIAPGDTPALPQLTPTGVTMATNLDPSFSKVGISRAVLEERIASAADDPHNVDYGKLSFCSPAKP